ncbi:MAG: DNA-3-methyladenine glycosylase [Gemmataceae bacterium]|nr:DNA-3-methyladenine glycosylase [Gemmataceae bacterium]
MNEVYRKARRHLARRDAVLKQLIASVGPCTLPPSPTDRFGLLVRSIIAQQISTKAAHTIGERLRTALGRPGVKPSTILKASDELLRGAGLSSNKARSLRDLAEKVHTGIVPLDELHEFDDEKVIELLVPVRGIGRWTAQMFLIFALGRLDVLPVDDLGLRAGAQRAYELAELPGRKELEELGEPWRPYRSIATWYFWRSLSSVPQSQTNEMPKPSK